MPRSLVLAMVFFGAMAGGFGVLSFLGLLPNQRILVAVLDTGAGGADRDGHGTRVARVVAESGAGPKVVSIQIAESGVLITGAALARGVRDSLARGVKVICIPNGTLDPAQELVSALDDAKKRGSIVVAAAGVGVPNPFQPVPLSKLLPQAHPGVIVVAALPPEESWDLNANFGPEVDLAVSPPESDYGSSFSAARVCGLVSQYFQKKPWRTRSSGVEEIRARLRAASVIPSSVRARGTEAMQRLGFGKLDEEAFLSAPRMDGALDVPSVQVFETSPKKLGIALSFAKDIRRVGLQWNCLRRKAGQEEEIDWKKNALVKGRAWIEFDRKPGVGCPPRLLVEPVDGEIREVLLRDLES